ncbi:hypothetical protein [Burkholderia sp. 3C]
MNAGILSALYEAPGAAGIPGGSGGPLVNSGGGSTIVTIPSRVSQALHIYLPDGTVIGPDAAVGAVASVNWQNNGGDPVSDVMAADYMSNSISGQFNNLGSALLERFTSTGSNFSQSVTVSAANGSPANALGAQGVQGDINLVVQTVSGASVSIELSSKNGTLGVSVNGTGTLSDADRTALSKLADGFQQAIDGLSGSPPALNLTGLTQYDFSVLSSVNLQYSVSGDGADNRSANISLSDTKRTVNITDSAGTVNLSVDAASVSALGSSTQQSAAITSYLAQFDHANQEGRGNSAVMNLFKDAFTQLNGNMSTPSQQIPGTDNQPWLEQAAHSMLTGLPDFTGSVTDTPVQSNPVLPKQTDDFSYQVSQTTQVDGQASQGAITQNQQSRLSASYHTALDGGSLKKPLSAASNSQSYDYAHVSDEASSTVSLLTEKGKLKNANLRKSENESTKIAQFLHGVKASDVTTPHSTTESKDLRSLLTPMLNNGQAAANGVGWQQLLSTLHGMILLSSGSIAN